jgi:hypothetical protein
MSSILTTFISENKIKSFLYKTENLIKIKKIKIWYLSKSEYMFSNTIILLQDPKTKLFLSSNKNSIYSSKFPTNESIWITCYDYTNINVCRDLRHITNRRHLTNIYGLYLIHTNEFSLSKEYRNIVFIHYFDIYSHFSTITFNIDVFQTEYKAYLIKIKNDEIYKKYKLWSLTQDIDINSNLVIILQEYSNNLFLNVYKDIYTNRLNMNSILVCTKDLYFDYEYRTISSRIGDYLYFNKVLNNNTYSNDYDKLYLRCLLP